MKDRLFVLQVVVVHEDQWFEPYTEIVCERIVNIQSMKCCSLRQTKMTRTGPQWIG